MDLSPQLSVLVDKEGEEREGDGLVRRGRSSPGLLQKGLDHRVGRQITHHGLLA